MLRTEKSKLHEPLECDLCGQPIPMYQHCYIISRCTSLLSIDGVPQPYNAHDDDGALICGTCAGEAAEALNAYIRINTKETRHAN